MCGASQEDITEMTAFVSLITVAEVIDNRSMDMGPDPDCMYIVCMSLAIQGSFFHYYYIA